MSSRKSYPFQRLLPILIALSVIAWSTRNFWNNVDILRNLEGEPFRLGGTLGMTWLLFMGVFVIAPFGFGVFLLWRALSSRQT